MEALFANEQTEEIKPAIDKASIIETDIFQEEQVVINDAQQAPNSANLTLLEKDIASAETNVETDTLNDNVKSVEEDDFDDFEDFTTASPVDNLIQPDRPDNFSDSVEISTSSTLATDLLLAHFSDPIGDTREEANIDSILVIFMSRN